MASSSSSGLPPGFRFHPTEEELVYYYLKKKVAMERFDLEVIREVDLNKVEPWELQDKCAVGSGLPNEWYFFSRRDRKYPTGLRMNRATAAGFWKATGRDKCIGSGETMGLRKTLVFYRGRAPRGQKTDWIMHEYRLHGDNTEYAWVVCCVFKKKALFKDINVENSNVYIPQQITHTADMMMILEKNPLLSGGIHKKMYPSPSISDRFSTVSNYAMQNNNAKNLVQVVNMDRIHHPSLFASKFCEWGKGGFRCNN